MAELEIEVALEEILNDLVKNVPQVSIKNLRILKQSDDIGSYYKVKIITGKK